MVLSPLKSAKQSTASHKQEYSQHGLDLVDVVTYAVGAPQVGYGVLVTRIHLVELLEQHGIQIGQIGQQGTSVYQFVTTHC